MDKLFEIFFDWFQEFSKRYLPAIYRWIEAGFHFRDRATTATARLLRTSGDRGILLVAILTSAYALYLYGVDVYKPNTPKPSHDTILKARFSSPVPSANIVILDVDERSIANMADQYGRWPWRRDVLADGLQKLSEYGTKGILFNVLLSEPDKQNPAADRLMNVAADTVKTSAYPVIRLAQQNDGLSQLKVSSLPGTIVEPKAEDNTIAVIVPLFPGMHERLGIANQQPDSDGIVRRYPFYWAEPGFKLPSIVATTLFVSDLSPSKDLPDSFSLNWRNKKGTYQRISFSDLFLDQLSEQDKKSLKNALVVVGVSAPGIGQTKPTGVKATTDDSEIIATAIDDALHDTHLRITPAWVLLVLNLVSIWSLYLVFSVKTAKNPPLNKIFVVLQTALGGLTMLSASYTSYLVDLTDSMKFALGVFAAIKLAQSLDDRWSRGRKGYRRLRSGLAGQTILIISYFDNSIVDANESELQREIEKIVGVDRVVRIDDLFSGESFVKNFLSGCHGLVICVSSIPLKLQVIQTIKSFKIDPVSVRECPMTHTWDLEDKNFAKAISPALLANIGGLLGPADGKPVNL
ncbi:CHASE2 domain-containing protein [beta proteobacterium MWH-UniP1]